MVHVYIDVVSFGEVYGPMSLRDAHSSDQVINNLNREHYVASIKGKQFCCSTVAIMTNLKG